MISPHAAVDMKLAVNIYEAAPSFTQQELCMFDLADFPDVTPEGSVNV